MIMPYYEPPIGYDIFYCYLLQWNNINGYEIIAKFETQYPDDILKYKEVYYAREGEFDDECLSYNYFETEIIDAENSTEYKSIDLG